MPSLDKQEFSILCHSLGRTERGELKPGHREDYRNHFVTGEGSTDYPACTALVSKGLMVQRRSSILPDISWLFQVTDEGKQAIQVYAAELPKPPKLSRSKQRYRRYLEYGDTFDSFLAFCRWDSQPGRSWNESRG